MITARGAGSDPITWTDSPIAAPAGSRSVAVCAPDATGITSPQRVEPSADNVPKRMSVPGFAPWVRTTVAERGSSDSPKNHEAVCPECSDGLGPG